MSILFHDPLNYCLWWVLIISSCWVTYYKFIASPMLLNTQAPSYFSLLKWHFNKYLYQYMFFPSKYNSRCTLSECTDRSKKVWPFLWLLKWFAKFLSKDLCWFTITNQAYAWQLHQNLVKSAFNFSEDTYFICPSLLPFLQKLLLPYSNHVALSGKLFACFNPVLLDRINHSHHKQLSQYSSMRIFKLVMK